MTINIISVGKIKESGLKSLIFEYEKRISKFAKINIIELKDLASENASSEADKLIVLEEEGQNILSKILDRDYVIALAIEGNKYSSERFAELIEKGFVQGGAKLTFIIGGSLGLSQRVKLRANSLISFSEMTFPHQLMKLILLEQTYRAFKILNNEPYHK